MKHLKITIAYKENSFVNTSVIRGINGLVWCLYALTK